MKRALLRSVACLLAVAGAALAQGAAAQPGPRGMEVTGGVLDPTITSEEAYLGTPAAAPVPPICKPADLYAKYLTEGKFDKVPDLYADNAIVFTPFFGKKLIGRAALTDFYLNTVSKAKPNIVAVSYAAGPGECFQIMATQRTINGKKYYVMSTVDHFTINKEGKITRMIAYARPSAAPVKLPAN